MKHVTIGGIIFFLTFFCYQQESSASKAEGLYASHISGHVTEVKEQKEEEKKEEKQNKSEEKTKKSEEPIPIAAPSPKSKELKETKELLEGKTIILKNRKITGQNQDLPDSFKESKAKFIILNFDKAKLRDVIVAVADLLKINYTISSGIKGKVSIHTSEKIPIKDALPIFQQILAMNGVALIKSGRLYKFVPSKDLFREPIEIYIGRDNASIPDEDKIIFQIIPIHYIPAATLQGILVPLLTKNGMFMEVAGLNRLYLVETATNVKRIIDIINALDLNMFDQLEVKLYEVKHADSLKIIEELNNIFTAMGYGADPKQVLKFISLPRLKSILIISAFPKLSPTIDYWINKLDISIKNIKVTLLPVKYIGGNEIGKLIKELKTIFSALGYGNKGMLKDTEGHVLDFIKISRLNSILLINSYPNLLPKVQEWLERLDQPPIGEDSMKVYVYYVQHSDAGNIASILNQLFAKKWRKEEPQEEADQEESEIAGQQESEKGKKGDKKGTKKKKTSQVKSGEERGIEMTSLVETDIVGDINIISDPTTNSLIIRTNPRNYSILIDTIKKLDVMPMQVLIEVIVAELQLDDSTRYGLEWAMKEQGSTQYGVSSTGNGTISNPSSLAIGATGIQGLSFFINKSDELLAMLKASSRESKLEILSSPMLLTSENQPASISIVNQIPIESTTVDPSSSITRTSIQFKDVGITLEVTPKISRNRFVSLSISQEVSQVSDAQTSLSAPAIFSRRTSTNVVVKDKQTLVIAGLMEERDNQANSGIPGLFKLPFLGCLFGSQVTSKVKTELLIFITPHVISGTTEADRITNDFKKKLKLLNNMLKKGSF